MWNDDVMAGSLLGGTGQTTPGIGQEITYMFIISVIYTTILVLIEYGYMKKLLNTILKQKDLTFKNESDDIDVQNETNRVQTLIQTGTI